jgi:hypothetical protein
MGTQGTTALAPAPRCPPPDGGRHMYQDCGRGKPAPPGRETRIFYCCGACIFGSMNSIIGPAGLDCSNCARRSDRSDTQCGVKTRRGGRALRPASPLSLGNVVVLELAYPQNTVTRHGKHDELLLSVECSLTTSPNVRLLDIHVSRCH